VCTNLDLVRCPGCSGNVACTISDNGSGAGGGHIGRQTGARSATSKSRLSSNVPSDATTPSPGTAAVEAARAATAAAVRREQDVHAQVDRDEQGNVWDWGDIEQRLGALQHSLRTPPPPVDTRPTPVRRALPTPSSRGGSYAKQFSAASVAATPTPTPKSRARKGKAVVAAADSPAVRRAGGWAH
jgi:hypothetical protein